MIKTGIFIDKKQLEKKDKRLLFDNKHSKKSGTSENINSADQD